MPLQNYQYDTIMREYSKTQSQNRRILEERTQEIYEKIPRIREIDEEVATFKCQKGKSTLKWRIFQSRGSQSSNFSFCLRSAMLCLYVIPIRRIIWSFLISVRSARIQAMWAVRNVPVFKKAEIELLYTQSNLKEILKKENFDHFSFDYYSDTMKNEATGLTERETAKRAYDIARGFVRNFDDSFENLFLYGDTGVGKTFLSHCIAHELLESAHCVMYFSAFDLFDLLAESKFSREKTEGEELVFDSDLLIIDDLGNPNLPTALSLPSCFCA